MKPTASDSFTYSSKAYGAGTFVQAGENHARSIAKRVLDEKPLHPSWEAKRKAKERLNALSEVNPSVATKIKFD
jgi:hypothetical protein